MQKLIILNYLASERDITLFLALIIWMEPQPVAIVDCFRLLA
jgi:hypothetical protein